MTLETPAARSDRGVPLSPAQQAALLPERLARITAANVFLALEIPAALADGVAARTAEVLAAHEILRTVYPDDRRVPYQRVESTPSGADIIEIGDAALTPALLTDAGHAFDLATEFPVRIRLYRLPARAVLSLTAHPVAADDRTLDLLATQLLATDPIPATAQYRDFTAEQVKTLTAKDDSLAFWTERLANLPEQLLLTGKRPAIPRSARAVVEIPSATVAALASDVDSLAVLTALIGAALRELGASTDIPVGIASAARSEDAANVLGNFANYLVLPVDSPRGGAPRELVGAASRLLAEAYANAGTRIERLTHQLRGPGAAAQGGLFQVLAGVRAGVLEVATGHGVAREIARAMARPHGVDLIVDAIETASGWTVTVDLAEELSRRHSAGEFARLLARTAESWSAAPDTAMEAGEVQPSAWFVADDDSLDLDPLAISGLGGPPRNDAERAIADALREILDLDDEDEVGREDNFFALGGDSVAALRFVTVLAEQGHILDVQKVFEFPAVYEMAENLTAEGVSAQPEPVAEVAPMAASGLDAAALSALAGKLAAR